jgi:hypothetical protein
MNKSLLCKWPWKLENRQGTWQTILSKKYFTNLVLAQARMGPVCSHFWQSLMSVNDIFQQYSERVMLGGEKTLFWKDNWVNNAPLSVQFPRLYQLSF